MDISKLKYYNRKGSNHFHTDLNCVVLSGNQFKKYKEITFDQVRKKHLIPDACVYKMFNKRPSHYNESNILTILLKLESQRRKLEITDSKGTYRCTKCDFVFDRIFYAGNTQHDPRPLECPKCHSIELDELEFKDGG